MPALNGVIPPDDVCLCPLRVMDRQGCSSLASSLAVDRAAIAIQGGFDPSQNKWRISLV